MLWLIGLEDGITGPLLRVSFLFIMYFIGFWFLLTGCLLFFNGFSGFCLLLVFLMRYFLLFYSCGLFQPTRIRKAQV